MFENLMLNEQKQGIFQGSKGYWIGYVKLKDRGPVE